MIRAYSYPQIVGAVTWRAMLIGGGLGALYGTALYFPVAAVYLLLMGGAGGIILGIVDGLFMSSITWLCRPIKHQCSDVCSHARATDGTATHGCN